MENTQIETGGPFLSLIHAEEKTNPVGPEQTKTQECRNKVKRTICRNVSIK